MLAASLGALLWAPAVHAADLTGHWRGAGNAKYEIGQTGASVSLTRAGSTETCEGTIDGSDVEIACDNPNFPRSYSLVLSGDESTLSGLMHTIQCVFSVCQAVDISVTFQRCECFDGNSANGDGCDLRCNVEACNECSGDPSTCTPLPDASACEAPSFCVSGGTCSAGSCEGGVESAQCLDVSGTWLRATRSSYDFIPSSVFRSEFVHEADGALTVFSLPSGTQERTGTVDTGALVLQMDGTGSWPSCGLSQLNGALNPEGNRYSATGAYLAATPRECLGSFAYDEVGIRCAPTALAPADGCSVDSCQRCEGDPVVCESVPDSTPCHSDDPCALMATCHAGECVSEFSVHCPACSTCDGAGGCVVAPRTDCRDAKTKLSIKSTPDSDHRSMRWDWKNGGPVEAREIGRPDVSTRVAICLFDESGAEPALIYSDSVNDEGSFGAGWSVDSGGGMHFRSRTDPISAIDLRIGHSAKMSLKAGSGSVGLPTPELLLPLRAQLQIQDGACFEGLYEADDVRRNRDGVFKARETP